MENFIAKQKLLLRFWSDALPSLLKLQYRYIMGEPSILSGDSTQYSSDSDSSNFAVRSPTAIGSRFKGVVNQLNGHWGAQIYANHRRVWLGTFKTEEEAAKAYDTAAIKLRNGEVYRNFPWNSISIQEPKFQSLYSTEEILRMIKDGSYTTMFSDYLMSHIRQGTTHNFVNFNGTTGVKQRHLFEKELTPSDVSKLNRLVIPKKFAVRYFPQFADQSGRNVDDMELIFYESSMSLWKFRYCYWKSSQSFVFTRGWNRFTKEKGLKARDRVIFSVGDSGDGPNDFQKMFMIDVSYYNGADVEGNNEEAGFPVGEPECDGNDDEMNACEEAKDIDGDVGAKKTGLKLFGVQIV